MSRHDFDKPALPSIPITAWPSLLSLDAVFVALAWQRLLLASFCHRSPTWPEMGSLAAAVWLIYVADRLLDASRLQLTRPHALRHRFYLHYARPFLLLWVVVLVGATFTAVQYLPNELLQGGMLLACAVLAYGAHLHFGSRISLRGELTPLRIAKRLSIPKEIRIGTLFALGVALTTWTQLAANYSAAASVPTIASDWLDMSIAGPWWTLSATICALALLFSCNCMLVARFEFRLDRAQAFASIATQKYRSAADHRARKMKLQSANIAVGCLPVLLLLLIQLPSSILTAVMTSALGLALSLVIPSRPDNLLLMPHASTVFDIRSVWVDAVLWTPPLMLSLL